ncbi:MAG: GNAT family N-acetyltransferase [Pseudomonadota bacterium]
MSDIRLRPAAPADRISVLNMTDQLASFEPPAWRSREMIAHGDKPGIRAHFEQRPGRSEADLTVATAGNGALLGFVWTIAKTDFFTGERTAHLEVLVVDAGARGRGLGRLLLARSEEWAREIGAGLLTLNSFPSNGPARGLYEANGFEVELLRYAKPLD